MLQNVKKIIAFFSFEQKENLDQARRKCSSLARQLSQEKMEKGSLEVQLEEIGKLRAEIAEQTKTIANLRQASAVSVMICDDMCNITILL